MKAFALVLLDLWTLLCLLFVLLTVIRAPHALYALGTLGRVFRILWNDLRWQTDDGHVAQALAILADDQAAAHVADEIGGTSEVTVTETGGAAPKEAEPAPAWDYRAEII